MMNRLPLFIIITMTSILSFGSCKTDDSTRTKFPWIPSIAAPRHYPVQIKYAFVDFGTKDRRIPVYESSVGGGIGQPGSEVDYVDFNEKGGRDMPTAVHLLWLSYAERKFYQLDAELSENTKERMLKMFRKPYYMSDDNEHCRYFNLVITMLPGGKVWLHLNGIGRTAIVCDTLQAKEVHMELEDFDKDAFYTFKTLDNSCKLLLSDFEGAAENLEKHGVPLGLWDKYKEWYRYTTKIEFENKETKLGTHILYKFTNGDKYWDDDSIPKNIQTSCKYLAMDWQVKDSTYTGYFFFDEDEILRVYPKAFGNEGKLKGELVVKVSKYNNWFDIFLQVGDKKYKLEKTKIHVFRDTPQKKDDDEPFYCNYWDSDVEEYIGE
ncbi:DUF2931 family protein [Prevotella melaninogenica]|uniref:DUF2931 family protein n=2 Tax=Prevotellaceae TaxID=171552 RepID=A0ABX7XSM4_9BACT|nr:DUF2931 family protein [Prevotella melaninogenica]QUB76706.1 DUF2931 family protein [Prevotella melaninogenica]